MSGQTPLLNDFWRSQNKKVDAFFISHPQNIGHLSDFWGSYGRIILGKNDMILVTDSRYFSAAKKLETKGIRVLERTSEEDFWKKLLEREKISVLGIERDHISLSTYAEVQKTFGKSIALKKISGSIEALRIQKSKETVQKIEAAAEIADKALQKTLPLIIEGKTEKEIAWQFERIAREEFAADGLSFATIVAFGEHTAVPHHEPTEKKLRKDMPILIDCGVRKDHFCSDLTRSFFFGNPSAEWENTYHAVQKAQDYGREKIRIGNAVSLPDTVAREALGVLSPFFTHSFGHGVGIDVHEAPTLSARTKGVFLENMIVTAEPGVYFPGKFGIRIEDLFVVEKENPRILSKSEKNFLL